MAMSPNNLSPMRDERERGRGRQYKFEQDDPSPSNNQNQDDYDFSAFLQSRLENVHISSTTEQEQTYDEFYASTVESLGKEIREQLNLRQPADDTLYQDLAAALVNCRIRAASSSSSPHRDEHDHENDHENETKTVSSSTTATATTTNSTCSSPAAAAACRRGLGRPSQRPDQRPTNSEATTAPAPFDEGHYEADLVESFRRSWEQEKMDKKIDQDENENIHIRTPHRKQNSCNNNNNTTTTTWAYPSPPSDDESFSSFTPAGKTETQQDTGSLSSLSREESPELVMARPTQRSEGHPTENHDAPVDEQTNGNNFHSKNTQRSSESDLPKEPPTNASTEETKGRLDQKINEIIGEEIFSRNPVDGPGSTTAPLDEQRANNRTSSLKEPLPSHSNGPQVEPTAFATNVRQAATSEGSAVPPMPVSVNTFAPVFSIGKGGSPTKKGLKPSKRSNINANTTPRSQFTEAGSSSSTTFGASTSHRRTAAEQPTPSTPSQKPFNVSESSGSQPFGASVGINNSNNNYTTMQFSIGSNIGTEIASPSQGWRRRGNRAKPRARPAPVVLPQTSHVPPPPPTPKVFDFSGRHPRVASLKEDGRLAYTNGNYKDSIRLYSEALKVCISLNNELENGDDLAVLYGNRAAGLMMLGACSAAAAECDRAIQLLTKWPKEGYLELRTECGPALMARLLCRKGKALLKDGKVQLASEAFHETIRCASDALQRGKLQCPTNQTSQDAGSQAEKVLKRSMTDAEVCLNDIKRCLEASRSFVQCGGLSNCGQSASDRGKQVQALMHVNAALSVAVYDETLHLKKVTLLASLKRWLEVASHCERIAADAVKLDGAFVDDLANMNPFEGAPPAIHLTPGFFEGQNASLSAKLSEKAVGEAILRLPHSIMAFYLRSLRLEERYEEAHRARTSLEMFVGQMSSRSTVDYRVKFAWLSRETDKLERTMRTKDSGDKLFRSGEYRSAAEKYACCLQIDAEGVAGGNPLEPNTAGGRLHAVLHCNRAACLMALGEYRDALKDCQAALRIHNHYMKAILRKARCYARLERYEDAMTEYKKYIKMVDDANMGRSPVNTTCCFDLPSDIDSVELKKVKQELKDVQQEKLNVERREAEEAAKQKERKKWYDENFNSQSDAQSRRNQWYNSKEEGGSFRWDPYGGRSPNKSGRGASYRKNQQSQSQQHQQDKPQNQKRPNASSYQYGSHQNRKKEQPRPETHRDSVDRSSSSNISDTHYSVLKVNTVATDADIKKAYRKMALLYHPDKNKDPSAADTFRRIKDAFEVLSDETERRKYDRQIGIAGVRPFVYRGM